MSGVEERTDATEPHATRVGDRLTFALRQFAIAAVVLLVLGALTEASRPDDAVARDIVESPFRWAIVAWLALLVLNAVAFERSQMRRLQGTPLALSIALGVCVMVVGLVAFDGGTASDRFLFLFLGSIGATTFWWPVFGLASLLWRLVKPTPPRSGADAPPE